MNINDVKQMEKLDAGFVAESIAALPEQLKDALKQAQNFKIPASYKKINRIVLSGMGGSNLGERIISSLFREELKVPLLVEAGYAIPGYVDKNTLFIISSYSGTTEEPLSTYAAAKKRGAKIIGLSAVGKNDKLDKMLISGKDLSLTFAAGINKSQQPRLGLGYAVVALLLILQKVGAIKFDASEIGKAADFIAAQSKKFVLKNNLLLNPAKKAASEIFSKQAVLVGGEFLEGNLHALRNQFCENSKNFASYLVLPDMNHYAIEGLGNPASNKKDLIFVFFESDLYHPRVQKRLTLTKEIVKKNKIQTFSYKLTGVNKLIQSFEILNFGSWLTFYLAMLNEVNPSLIPWVDWFKKKLKS
jgi:Glucose-6-phosphate isomerase